MNIKKNKKTFNSKKISIIFTAVLVLMGVGYFMWVSYFTTRQPSGTTSQPQSTDSAKDDRTYKSETENKEITVPNNVDPSSIKNYNLITENEAYKIRELNGEYYVTLYAIINRPDQSDAYHDQLRQYKQDALTYLRAHDIDPNKKKIYYEPSEATSL